MMLNEHGLGEIMAIFQVELAEHCQSLTSAFLALEKEPEPEERGRVLGEAFRAAHSMKGAARAVAFGAVEAHSSAHRDWPGAPPVAQASESRGLNARRPRGEW